MFEAQGKAKEEQSNQNRNQGLINTIVNRNDQLKRRLEPPEPHNWWRELVLLLVVGSALIIIMSKIFQKIILPRLRKFIFNYQVDIIIRPSNVSPIGKHLQNNEPRNSHSGNTRLEEKTVTQHETFCALNDAVQHLNAPRRIKHQ